MSTTPQQLVLRAPAAVRTVAPARLATVRESLARLAVPMPGDRLLGWLGPLAVTLVAGILRFWRLGEPRAFVFDETYYAKDGFSLLRYGVEQEYVKDADARILAGDLDVFTGHPGYVVHPPAGKWLIALGERMFGMTPFGWRFAVAVVGTLSVLVLARVGRRLFRSTVLGCVAGLLLALDGLHFVESRTALLDGFLMFWVLAAFACLLADRDAGRSRLAGAVLRHRDVATGMRLGPWLGVRPWRLAAGICLGLACATKWNGLYILAALGLLTFAWDVGARKAAGVRRPLVAALVLDAGQAVASLVLLAVVVYVGAWSGWLLADGSRAYFRDWGAQNPATGLGGLVPDALRSLWHYHAEAYRFHVGLSSPHPYSANSWSWPILGRPTSMFYEGPKRGELGCAVDQCSRAVTALGTPAVWWAGLLAVPVVVALWLGRRDWRAGAIAVGFGAGYLPWFGYQGRTIYSFYAIVLAPFVVLAVTMCLGLLLGPRPSDQNSAPTRRTWGSAAVGAYLLLVLANFAWLYPVLSAQVIPYADWARHMWFRSWI